MEKILDGHPKEKAAGHRFVTSSRRNEMSKVGRCQCLFEWFYLVAHFSTGVVVSVQRV